MIWGLSLQPGELYIETIKDEVQLSMAALESRNLDANTEEMSGYNQVIIQTESAEYVLCTLVHGMLFQQYLDMKLMPGEKVKFSVQGKYVVHLTGYSFCSPTDDAAAQLPVEEKELTVHLPLSEDEADGWEAETLKNIKEEPPERQDDYMEPQCGSSTTQDEYSRFSERVGPPQREGVRPTEIQHRPLHRTLTHQRRPLMQPGQQMHNQRVHAQIQSRARRRLIPGQRSQFMVAMQRASIRHRGALVQNRRMQRNASSHVQSGPRIQVQPLTPPTLPSPQSHHSPIQEGSQHTIPQQTFMSESVSVQPNLDIGYTSAMQHDMVYSSVGQDPRLTSTQIQNLPGSSVSDMPPHSMHDDRSGLSLRDSNNTFGSNTSPKTSIPNIQKSPIENLQASIIDIQTSSAMNVAGPSGVDLSGIIAGEAPGPFGTSIPTTPSMDMPGTSHGTSEQLTQEEDTTSPNPLAFTHTDDSQSEERYDGENKCRVCAVTFLDRDSCKMHESSHENDKNWFQCSLCKKVLSTIQTLRQHYSIHTGVRPYKCSLCFRSFSMRKDLLRHEWVHSGQRPFHCRYCPKSFSRQDNCENHERTLHPYVYRSRKEIIHKS